MKNSVFVILLVLILQSCKTDNNLTSIYEDIPVIESYLNVGDTVRVKISRQVPFSEDNTAYSNENIDSLSLFITLNSRKYKLSSIGNGIYQSKEAVLIVEKDQELSLEFMFNKNLISANTNIPSTPENYKQSVTSIKAVAQGGGSFSGSMPDPIELTWDNLDNSNYILVIENMETSPVLINDDNEKAPPARLFRSTPTTSNSIDLQVRRFNYYGKHRLILYHLNPDYASLYDSKGSSSQNLTNPSTNISNGLGIFTGVNSDTLYLNVVK